MKLSKFYHISTLLIVFLLASFSIAEAAHHQTEIIQPTKKEIRKSTKKNKGIIKAYVQNLVPKRLKKETKTNGSNLLSGILALTFGVVSILALLAALGTLEIGFVVFALIAAILGIIFAIISIAKIKKSEDNTAGIIGSVLGLIASLGGGLISTITLLIYGW